MIYLFSDEDENIDGTTIYFHYFYCATYNNFYYTDTESHHGIFDAVLYGWKFCTAFEYDLPDRLNIIHTDFNEVVVNICEDYVEKMIFDKL